MRISPPNIAYALVHPRRALRYLRWRDGIPYSDIAKFLPADPVILEAGAANGSNTVEMAEFWPRATIHAFEPVPGARQALLLATAPFAERVRVYPFALGAESGKCRMHVSGGGGAGDSQSSSLLSPSAGHFEEYRFVTFGGSTEVDVVTPDSWAGENSIARIDFLWLDMQGSELRALSAATSLLKTARAIHLEVANVQLHEGGPLYPEILEWMSARGFVPAVEAIFRVGGNVLFVRK